MPNRPRVFVSSVMEDFEEFREAARSGIELAGGFPVLVEDQPSVPDSPRNACLDLVASSDAAIFIVGGRGGWRAPSGKLAVREEFDEAQARNLPSLVFLQETDRDPDAQQLASDLSKWLEGRLRKSFTSADQLQTEVVRSLAMILNSMKLPDRDPQILQDTVSATSHGGGQDDTVLRLSFAPVVEAEVIDPLDLDSQGFYKQIQSAAHDTEFFDYGERTERKSTSSTLEIVQGAEPQGLFAKVVLDSTGVVTLASTVRSEREREGERGWIGFSMGSHFEIIESDLRQMLATAFRFLAMALSEIDEHQRFPSWMYNVALINPQMKRIVKTPTPEGQGFSAGLDNPDYITAFDSPRTINRSQISHPDREIDRIATLVKKRLDDAR